VGAALHGVAGELAALAGAGTQTTDALTAAAQHLAAASEDDVPPPELKRLDAFERASMAGRQAATSANRELMRLSR
jgi:hypothetical protein